MYKGIRIAEFTPEKCKQIALARLDIVLQKFVLEPNALEYLQTIAFIRVIAALVQMVEIVLKKVNPGLYQALGVYLPLITTNCAVLGVAVLNSNNGYGLLQSTLSGCFSALGFTLSLLLFSCIRERLEMSDMPKWMEGFPGALIAAGLMAVSFIGFGGLI